MTLSLYTQVASLKNYNEQSLVACDVVDFRNQSGIPNGYFVKAFDAPGKTIAVFVVYENDLEALTNNDVLTRRTFETA